MFKITLNRELSTKLIQKNSLPSTAHESQFSDKQKFHSTPKQVSTEVLSNWPFILWLQRTASSAWWFTFLSRELSTSWYEIMHLPKLGDVPLSLTYVHYSKEWHKPHTAYNSKQWHKPHVQTALNSNTKFTCVYHSEEPHKPHLCKLQWTVTQTSPVHITMATIISR